ncbi:hypothetical protein L484_022937 [Morus notabilis]|uniref:Uncharacterized protein n=1 Tax=Morus notabilis TaxID=981085 RepID=W9RFQ2_9ROSA|nr:hypothetical protein L484_022937 [Morus notabilis]
MAYFSSKLRKDKTMFMIIIATILIISLLTGSCSAARLGKISLMMKITETTSQTSTEKNNELHLQTGFQFRGQTFNFFPKGKPVPPSGPSKRHNSSPKN